MLKKSIILLMVSFILLLCSNSIFAEQIRSDHVIMDRQEWESYFTEDFGYDSPEEFVAWVEEYIEKICTYLNVEFKDKIKIKFLEKGATSSADSAFNMIYLGATPAELERTMVHEMSHILAHFSNRTLNEGMALHVTSVFIIINEAAYLNQFTQYLKEDLSDEKIILYKNLIRGKYSENYLEPEDIDYMYICGYSFVQYMVNQYSIEKFMEFRQGDGYLKSYQDVFGKSMEEVIDDWILSFQQ